MLGNAIAIVSKRAKSLAAKPKGTKRVDWFCDRCGAYMNNQPGFDDSREWCQCARCGWPNDLRPGNIVTEEFCKSFYNMEGRPDMCRGCAGPYPKCWGTCPNCTGVMPPGYEP